MSLLVTYPGLRFHWPLIQQVATRHGLDPRLVAAVVLQESSANTDAFRHERDFWNRYLKLKPEWQDKNPRRVSSSYGLMQVMFPVALEQGYPSDWPPEELFNPETGLEYGCRYLQFTLAKMQRLYPQEPAQRILQATLASYNGGFQGPDKLRPQNRAYADAVLRLFDQLKGTNFA